MDWRTTFNIIWISTDLLIATGFAIVKIVIGAVFLDDCQIKQYIPIYLIVDGCFNAVLAVVGAATLIYSLRRTFRVTSTYIILCAIASIVGLFLFAWLIAGSVWTFSIKNDVTFTDTAFNSYCNYTLYWFTFWVIIVTWILFAINAIIIPCSCISIRR